MHKYIGNIYQLAISEYGLLTHLMICNQPHWVSVFSALCWIYAKTYFPLIMNMTNLGCRCSCLKPHPAAFESLTKSGSSVMNEIWRFLFLIISWSLLSFEDWHEMNGLTLIRWTCLLHDFSSWFLSRTDNMLEVSYSTDSRIANMYAELLPYITRTTGQKKGVWVRFEMNYVTLCTQTWINGRICT
jgi:hypothetical protein